MLWLIWVLLVLAVLAGKAYTARAIVRMNLEISELSKYLSRIAGEEKTVRANAEIMTRNLAQTQKAISLHRQEIEKLNEEVTKMDQEEKQEMMESKKRLSGSDASEEG